MSSEASVRPRRTPQQRRSRGTVDAIVLAAAHILRSEGIEAVNTNRVAKLAGVSIGSLYQYFPNKQAVIDELRSRYAEWFEAELRDGIERGANAPLRAGVRASIARMVGLLTVDPDLQRKVSSVGSPLAPEELSRFRERTEAYLRDNADQLRPLDPALASAIVTRATEALLHGMARDEPEWLGHPAFVDEITQLVVGYLAPS